MACRLAREEPLAVYDATASAVIMIGIDRVSLETTSAEQSGEERDQDDDRHGDQKNVQRCDDRSLPAAAGTQTTTSTLRTATPKN
jgi:hypothetical protein